MKDFDGVSLTAFFPERCLCFGEWQHGHMRAERWVPRGDAKQIIDFAKKVQDVGGMFYMQGRKYKHVVVRPGTPQAYSIILQDGYIHSSSVLADTNKAIAAAKSLAARKLVAKARALAKSASAAEGAAGDPAALDGEAQKLYVLVTRKVSLTPETKGRKSGV